MLRPYRSVHPRVAPTAFIDQSAQVIGDVVVGADIGSDSIVAAGSLVVERLAVPSRALVMGSPGRVRRILTEDEVASIRWYAESYVGYKDEYITS